jgi:DNA replicative helicase MCM subunit Mcm2 (Cdc46/Mcm family)
MAIWNTKLNLINYFNLFSGTPECRWKPNQSVVDFAIRAISVIKEETKPRIKCSIEEHSIIIRDEWFELLRTQSELELRDKIVASIAPSLKGMYPLKLAIALILCSVNSQGEAGTSDFTRQNSHLMLVGDPGNYFLINDFHSI